MAALYTLARGTVKLLLVLFLLVTSLYLILLVINWQDAKPNADSLHMQSLLQHEQIPAEQNGYRYLMANHANSELTLSGPLQQLYHQCNQPQGCNEQLTAQADLAEVIAAHPQLMAFYQQLLQYPKWQEPPPEPMAIPHYQRLSYGQRLWLLQAWLDAQSGKTDQVKLALQADYEFWQTVLANTNSLLTKMISTAALKNHFMFVPQIIAQLPAEQRQAAVPEGWTNAFSDKELSIAQVLAGEWHFGAEFISNTWQGISPDDEPDLSVSETLLVWVSRPLMLLEDTRNIYATQLVQWNKTTQHSEYPWYSWLRNPVGKMFMATGTVPYEDYQQRLLKLEQLRQEALKQVN